VYAKLEMMNILRKVVLTLLVSVLVTCKSQSGPVLTISQGKLEGKYAESRDGRQYYEFKAVPYGQFSRRFEVI